MINRVSIVSYLNSIPFIYGIKNHSVYSNLDLSLNIPSVCANKFLNNEIDIGLEYKKKGFYTVVIEEPAIIDLGAGRGCDDPTRIMPNRRKTNAPRGIKRLWKHIKTMKF